MLVYENVGGMLELSWSSSALSDGGRLIAADLTQDGLPDLVLGGPEQSIEVFPASSGGFAHNWTAAIEEKGRPNALGDWDADGDLDLAVGTGSDLPVRLYENQSGSFHLVWSSPENYNNDGIAWVDWDGDGDFSSSDFILAFRSNAYEKASAVAATSVAPLTAREMPGEYVAGNGSPYETDLRVPHTPHGRNSPLTCTA